MLVFIRKIPMAVTCDELHGFVYQGMSSFGTRFFGKQGTINELEILKFTNEDTRSVEYHGLVDIEPATSADTAIMRLNQAFLNGAPVEVREFIDRSPSRDRRNSQTKTEISMLKNLRMGDRRRSRLTIEPVSVSGHSISR